MQDRFLLGIDCGLTNVKAVVFDMYGHAISCAGRPTPRADKTIDTAILWQATIECIREAAAGHEIMAAGVCGHGNGLYALDNEGSILCALPPMSDEQKDVIISDKSVFYNITHQNPWAGQPMQLLRYVKSNSEELYNRINCVIHCKDFIRYKLTGELCTDYSDASASALLDAQSGMYADELFRVNGLGESRDIFPEVLQGCDIAGYVTREAAEATGLKQGIPIATGLIDLDACRIGSGVTKSGQISVTAGTWAIAVAPTNGLIGSRSITQNCFSYDRDHRIAVVSAPVSCVNLDWFLERFMPGVSYSQAESIALRAEAKNSGIVYLPYIYHDMARPQLEAAFVGMKPDTSVEQLLRAVYDGVLFAHMDQVNRLKKAGAPIASVRFSGGAAQSHFWRQLFADGFGINVETTRETQVGALGAAIMAACSVQMYPSVPEAVSHMVALDQVTLPRSIGLYDKEFAKFMELAGEV